jgi:hypothetical protein
MTLAAYFRRQAEHCSRLSRSCFDLSVAEQLRTLADELRLKAAEIDSAGPPVLFMPQRAAAPRR